MLLDEYLLLGLSAYEGGLLLYGSAVEIPVEPTEQSQIGGGRSRSRSKRSYIDEREITILFVNEPSVFHINVLVTDSVRLTATSTSNFKITAQSKLLTAPPTPYIQTTAKLQPLHKSFTLKSKSQAASFTAKITSIEIDLNEEEEIALLLSL